jgi:hypothetical protein
VFHSPDLDSKLCQEVDLATIETPAPKWLPLVLLGVGGMYLGMALLVFAQFR